MTELAEPAEAPPALQLLHIPLVDIEEHPANPRHDVGDVDEHAGVQPAGSSPGQLP